MTDLTLFTESVRHDQAGNKLPPSYRTSDPDTSKTAGKLPRGSQREKIYNAFLDGPVFGMTDYELATRCDMLRGTAAKRRGELVKLGLIQSTNFRRKTDTGSSGIIWRLVMQTDQNVTDQT